MTVVIKYESHGYTAYNENMEVLGRCSYVIHEDSYYNSIEDSWTCNKVNLLGWLKDSLRNKYGNITFKED